MTDPFDVLRAPVVPTDPDPGFAASLRARLERAGSLPRGVISVTAPVTTPVPTALIPYLVVPDGTGRDALTWYAEVLGARPVGDPVVMPDGRVGHAELALEGGTLYLAEEFPELGVTAPQPGRAGVSLVLVVPDAADTARRAVDRGASMPSEVRDDHGSRNATILDPYGHRWMLQTPLDRLPVREQSGDVGYAWLTAPDPDRAAAFYAAVLGWDYTPGHQPGGRNVEGQAMSLGIGPGEPGFHLSYAVADVAAAVAQVRAAGGTATEPEARPYGLAADCVDDQGVGFSLHAAGGVPRGPVHGDRPGDLSYLTLEVVDSARARAFYGTVLGWSFEPGGMPDGFTAAGVVPMTGLHGGNPAHTAVPMWKVDDVAAAVTRVRDAGGTATDPERQPYGTTSECTDDQGLRFYLGDT